MGLKGEGARAGPTRGAEVVDFAVAVKLCEDVDATGLRAPPMVALLLTFARGRAPGVGEGDVGSDLSGEGGRERS